jgi:hypothetical protein
MKSAGKAAYGLNAGVIIYENWGKHGPLNIGAKVAVSQAELFLASGIAFAAATGEIAAGGGPENLPADGFALGTFVVGTVALTWAANQVNETQINPRIDSLLP